MGWLSKIFKGSSHKVSEGQYNWKERHGEDTVQNEPLSSGDAWSEIEDIDRAIALSLSEEDQKRKNIAYNLPWIGIISLSFDWPDDESQLKEDEQLAKAIQESLNVESPPRYGNGNIYQPIPFPYSTGFSCIRFKFQ
ncbi:hypothetical protein Acr_04g0008720 [Actinidia rufa]|uniref:Uncharacterized protein n=1 Tax=Actinidia rufa TaxID=165716 RepID=A0A7J0EI32_9ERIC|nr:hypothetical protein Acr_04g0008720 [Actinidia rufa]